MRIVSRPSRFRRAVLGRLGVSSAFLCCVTLLGLDAHLSYAFPVAKLHGVKPIVETKPSKKGWIVARERTSLVFGDHVRTGPHGTAQVLFANGTELDLRSHSEIEIREPETPDKPLVVRLIGALSEVFVRVKGPTQIRTAAGIAASKNTEYSVRLDSEDQTTLTVLEGLVAFSDSQRKVTVDVAANEQSTVRLGGVPSQPVRVDASGLLSWTGDVGGLPLPFELPPSPRDPQALQDAKNLLKMGNALSAEAAFRALLNSPQADEARVGVALSLLSNRDRDGATAAIEGDNTPLAVGVRALLLLENNDARGAQTLLEPLAANDAPFQIYTLLALAQIQNSDVAGAQRSAARAVKLAPTSAGAQAVLSLAQFFAHTNEKAALQSARHAVELDPFSPLALLALGRVQAARGNLDEADQALEQAAALAPNLPGVQRDLGVLELAVDHLPRAERALRASLAASPDDARTLAALGTVLLRRGDRAGARETLDRAVALAPDDAYVRANRAAFLVENGDLEAASHEGDLLLARQNRLAPTGPNSAFRSTDDPALGALYIRLSESSLFRQQLNEALRYAREAVRLLPNSAPAQYQLGRVFLEQGRTTQAQNRFQLATILEPNNARARYALGYTQQLVAQGDDAARPLGQIEAAREGAPNVALSLQNQATPGAFELYQAAITDPTAVRASSRSFGDWQLNGRLGTDSSATGEASYLHESDDRRGLTAFGLRRDTTQGARRGEDNDETDAAITLGRKAKGSPSAVFAFASYQQLHPVTDEDFDRAPVSYPARRERPLVVLGANIAHGQSSSTRLLFQADHRSLDSTITTGSLGADFRSIHLEARHDQRLSDKWHLEAGVSTGQRRFDVAVANDAPASTFIYFLDSNIIAHNSVAYGRLAFEPSARLKLEGELKVRSFDQHSLSFFSRHPIDPTTLPSSDTVQQGGELLPSIIATYRSGRATVLRFRARRLLGGIDDFELLSPTDVFGFDESQDVPTLAFGERGCAFELEASHTFSDASFLRVGLFQFAGNVGSTPAETLESSRVQGLRVGYEGLLNRRTSFFTSFAWNGSRGLVLNTDTGGTFAPSTFSGLPNYTAEVGVQYLSDSGLFVQPSLGYVGPRFRNRFGNNDARQSLGGFPLFNLRVGKRFGLRRSFYVEVSNLFDRSYTLLSDDVERQQPGRQVRVGATLRF